MGEIAENYEVSRQAVYDNIRRTEKILEEYETKLQLFQRFQAQSKQTDELENYVRENYSQDGRLLAMIEQLARLEE